MKIAIVHDELIRRGGAEQVVKCFHSAFPSAPIYTMVYQPELTYPEFRNCTIKTSWFQRFVKSEKMMKRFFFPFGLLAMKQLDLSGFDVLLISSTYAAKYVKISGHSIVINYCHTPFRLAFDPNSYSQYKYSKGIKKMLFDLVLTYLRKTDFKAAQRTDYYITITEETRKRIIKSYGNTTPIEIIQPPVNCSQFYVSPEPKNYFLVVSRLEFYKKTDLVIRTFNENGLPLVIVGRGSKENELRKMAGPNITFKSDLDSTEIAKVYSGCKALIFAQLEDYGITPLEANASGRPVIAFGEGGVLETMIPFEEDVKKATAIFFKEQTVAALEEAIRTFERLSFDPEFIRNHSEKFDENIFKKAISDFVSRCIRDKNSVSQG